jgi:EmrB/QacA subfamily drug resistance transporter
MPTPLSKKQQFAVLVATIMVSAMAFIDSTALNVALPALQQDLGVNGSQLLWIVNSYSLFLSALMLVGGSLGDALGRKKVFIIGILIFSASSLLCGMATSSNFLIFGRSLQGIGAALMVPGSLSIISALFPAERRGWAIGTWSMFSALTTIGGPALGGWLAGMGWWRAIFFINIPFAGIALYFLIKSVPESKNENAKKVDLTGGLLATLALAGLTYGFIEAPAQGFGAPLIWGSLGIGSISLLSFVIYQARCPNPMMPLHLFKSKVFSSTNLLTLFLYGALGGFLFFFPLNLIQVQGYPPEIAGLTMLPFGLLIALLSRWSGAWADRIGIRIPLIIGPFITGVGFLLFARPGITAGPSEFWTSFFPAILVAGAGMGITVAPLTTAVMNAVSSQYTGVASGVNNAISRTAGVLAIAILGAYALLSFENNFWAEVEPLKLSIEERQELKLEVPKLAEAKAPASNLTQVKTVESAVTSSFVNTFQRLATVAAILAFLSSAVSLISIEGKNNKTLSR